MCPSFVEIRSVTSEIRRRKKERRKKEERKKKQNHSGKIKALRHNDAMRLITGETNVHRCYAPKRPSPLFLYIEPTPQKTSFNDKV